MIALAAAGCNAGLCGPPRIPRATRAGLEHERSLRLGVDRSCRLHAITHESGSRNVEPMTMAAAGPVALGNHLGPSKIPEHVLPPRCRRAPPRRKIAVMTKGAQAVLADALRLDSAARAELAAELLASLDGPADSDAESAWDAEIDRRIEAIEAGTIRLEPWEQVKRRIEKNLLGR
jgi:putative addiction module component (TIGR02574 family)